MAHLITDTATANFLTSSKTRFLLGPFMQCERTMKEAAESLGSGTPLNTFHRRVKQMLKLGLIEVVREEVRQGHRVKLYRTVSDAFIVPIEATTHVNLEAYLDEGFTGAMGIISQGTAKEMQRRAPRWGFKIFPSDRGGAFQRCIPLDANGAALEAPPEHLSFYGDCGLRLSAEDAHTFRQELQALYEKYLSLGQDEGEWHFFAAGFAPT